MLPFSPNRVSCVPRVKSWLVALLLGLGHAPVASAQPSGPPATPQVTNGSIDLAVGETRTLSAAGVRTYSVGQPDVAEVRLVSDGRQFAIAGLRPGTSTLLLIRSETVQEMLTINVFQRPMPEVEGELGALLSGMTGIRIRRVGARLFIEGGVSTEPELNRISRIAALYPGQVESLVVLGGLAADRKLNVRIDFFFVQYDLSKGTNYGLRYPPSIGGGTFSAPLDLLSGHFQGQQAALVRLPLPVLDLAATEGWAKVLKHSTVITSNGSAATFSSGGEQNFQVTAGLTAGIEAIAYGTRVQVLPRFDPTSGDLQMKLEAEVTDLTPPVSGLPGRTVSNLDTLVTLKEGQSIVLSGIRTQAEQSGSSGLPLLGELPIVGALFSSKSRATQSNEGAIFVVPSIFESLSPSATELLDRALEDYEHFSGDMESVEPAPVFRQLPLPAPSAPRAAPAAPAAAAAPTPAPQSPARQSAAVGRRRQ
jgi:pilus assembly protein CpaC